MSGQVVSFGGLARRLVNEGVVSAENMQKALAESQRDKIALVNYLVSRKLANAAQYGVMMDDIADYTWTKYQKQFGLSDSAQAVYVQASLAGQSYERWQICRRKPGF